jgi:hypothetical protein
VYLRALGLGSAFAQGSTGDSVNRTVQEKMKNSEEPSSPQMRSEKNRKQNHGSRSLEFSCGPDKQPNFADNASALQASRRPKDCHLVTRSVPFFHCCLPIACSLLARAASANSIALRVDPDVQRCSLSRCGFAFLTRTERATGPIRITSSAGSPTTHRRWITGGVEVTEKALFGGRRGRGALGLEC